eukprot:5385624-Alexandrium_andersonii.AAC.1
MHLIKTAVLPVVLWFAAFVTLPKDLLARFRTAVEKAVGGPLLVGRNRFLAWKGLGPRADPRYLVAWQVPRHARWRAARQLDVNACPELEALEGILNLKQEAPIRLQHRGWP